MKRRYDECLNEIYGTIKICGYEYEAARALKEVDPTAYRCGFVDWLDAECSDGRLVERDGEYFESED